MREHHDPHRRAPVLALVTVAVALTVAGCAPRAQPPIAKDGPAGQLQRTAEIVYHRMAIGYLETGKYTTNVLVDVDLPAGAKWTLLSYAQDGSSYRLRITSTRVEGMAWEVSPSGATRVASP